MPSSIHPRSYDSIAPHKLAFLGLGVMGYPMAGHLARAGHAVTVYNRTAAKAQAWCEEFADAAQQAPACGHTLRGVAGAGLVFWLRGQR